MHQENEREKKLNKKENNKIKKTKMVRKTTVWILQVKN